MFLYFKMFYFLMKINYNIYISKSQHKSLHSKNNFERSSVNTAFVDISSKPTLLTFLWTFPMVVGSYSWGINQRQQRKMTFSKYHHSNSIFEWNFLCAFSVWVSVHWKSIYFIKLFFKNIRTNIHKSYIYVSLWRSYTRIVWHII